MGRLELESRGWKGGGGQLKDLIGTENEPKEKAIMYTKNIYKII